MYQEGKKKITSRREADNTVLNRKLTERHTTVDKKITVNTKNDKDSLANTDSNSTEVVVQSKYIFFFNWSKLGITWKDDTNVNLFFYKIAKIHVNLFAVYQLITIVKSLNIVLLIRTLNS